MSRHAGGAQRRGSRRSERRTARCTERGARARSVWTIDLAHLLRRFGVAVEFTTVTLGANPAYARERFYRQHLRDDCRRVERLFLVRTGFGLGCRACSRRSARLSPPQRVPAEGLWV